MGQSVRIEDWLGSRSARQSAKRLREHDAREAVVLKTRAMMASGDWRDAGGIHVVELFGLLFAMVYGVACSELSGSARFYAAHAADDMVDQCFDGDVGAAVVYVRWAWEREAGREQWRRQHGRAGGMLSWRWVLRAGQTLDEYRLAQARLVGA